MRLNDMTVTSSALFNAHTIVTVRGDSEPLVVRGGIAEGYELIQLPLNN